jgi:hypothetical protein
MPNDQDSALALQPELLPGERLLWAGRPSNGVILRAQDAYLIPFSLLWGGFAIFWEMSASGFLNWNTWYPVRPVGQYFIWERFVVASYLRKRTFYAVTDRRVLDVPVFQDIEEADNVYSLVSDLRDKSTVAPRAF